MTAEHSCYHVLGRTSTSSGNERYFVFEEKEIKSETLQPPQWVSTSTNKKDRGHETSQQHGSQKRTGENYSCNHKRGVMFNSSSSIGLGRRSRRRTRTRTRIRSSLSRSRGRSRLSSCALRCLSRSGRGDSRRDSPA